MNRAATPVVEIRRLGLRMRDAMNDERGTKEDVAGLGFKPRRYGAGGTVLGEQMRDDARDYACLPVE